MATSLYNNGNSYVSVSMPPCVMSEVQIDMQHGNDWATFNLHINSNSFIHKKEIMTQQNKTLAECKDEVARNYGFKDWSTFLLSFNGKFTTIHPKTFDEAIDKAYELHASQFIKKEVVSSDVEQANHYQKASDKFAAFVKTKYDQKDHNTMYLFDNMIDAIYQSVLSGLIDECFGEQSTQQPAIEWLTDDEIKDLFMSKWTPGLFDIDKFNGAKTLQSKLKERVNCVDPVIDSDLVSIHVPLQLAKETKTLVAIFAQALAGKLFRSQEKYKHGVSWLQTDWMEKCQYDLNLHIYKGDPLDVAAYCAFMFFHKWPTCNKNLDKEPENLLKISDYYKSRRDNMEASMTNIFRFLESVKTYMEYQIDYGAGHGGEANYIEKIDQLLKLKDNGQAE